MTHNCVSPTLFSVLICAFFMPISALAQDTVHVSMATTLSGAEVETATPAAGCALTGFDITLNIVAGGSNWAGDMALAITDPNGVSIQIGGYNTGFGYTEAGAWPSSWNNTTDGLFSASIINLGDYGLAGDGCWTVEMMNAWTTGGPSDYLLELDLLGLCSSGTTSGCMDPNATNYDPCAFVDDGSCVFPPLSAVFSFSQTCAVPDVVDFSQASLGNVASYAWTFDGGNPASSIDPNPTVHYATAGDYNATLEIFDADGNSAINASTVNVSEAHRRLQILITPDNFPFETSFAVINTAGDTLFQGGAEGLDACVPDECLAVWMFDSGGDGFSVGGYYQVLLDEVVIEEDTHFDDAKLMYAGCAQGASCDDPLALIIGVQTAPMAESWYEITIATTGQYLIKTCDLSQCDTEIIVYDYCDMALFSGESEAFITYSDDDCGVQSQVTPIMEEGQTYYVRIVNHDPACSGSTSFEFDYLGGISGCMNIYACNYLPIATIADTCFLPGDPACSLIGPDLIINGPRAYSTLELYIENNTDACMIEEGCIQGFGEREVVRFDTEIANIGTEDYFIGAPSAQAEQFEWDACHNHYHYEGYAEYALYITGGAPMPEIGFKNGFCVMDLGSCNYGGGPPKYTCGNMGISAGCQDIYSRYLNCQWIDITDIPGGDYTLVIRVNWDFSPDANGSFELDYSNNAVGLCFSFERDATGAAINFTKTEDCEVPTDCIGNPYGSAVPDCAGNCPGFVIKGDLDLDGEVDADDPPAYIELLLEGVTSDAPCADLNADGELSVTDVALAADCAHLGHNHLGDAGVENHCDWNGPLLSPNQSAEFGISMPYPDSSFVDLWVHNPTSWLSGWEVQLSGATFTAVEPLYDTLGFHHAYGFTPEGYVMGVALQDSLLDKSASAQALLRIHFISPSADGVCLDYVGDVTNEDRHDINATGAGCVTPQVCTGDIDGNGNRDVNDLLISLGGFGCTGGECGPADLDNDGLIGVNDLLILLSLFGQPC